MMNTKKYSMKRIFLLAALFVCAYSSYSQVNLRIKGVSQLPLQTGNSGKFLTTNGTSPSWADIIAGIPSDSSLLYGNRWLNTFKISDTASKTWSWSDITGAPSFITNIPTDSSTSINNRILLRFPADTSTSINNRINSVLPSQTGNSGKYLTTNGTVASWGTVVGGSGDSSWVSTETGTSYNIVGTIFQTTFSGASLPAEITDVTPNATVTINNRLELSGGNTNTTPLAVSQGGTSTVYANRLNFGFYPHEKIRYSTTIIPQDKTATSYGIAFHFLNNALFFSTAMRVRYNLATDSDSGRILIDYDLGSTVARSGNLAFNAGDTLDIDLIRDYWTITAKMRNRATGKYVDVIYTNASAFGTGGRFYMGVLGGSQHITRFKIESYNRTAHGFTFLGDSQTAGNGASSEEKSFASLVFRGNETKFSNLSNPSVTLNAIITSHLSSAIAIGNSIIITAGYNDRRDLGTDTNTFRQRVDSIIQPARRANLPVYLATLIPNTAGTNNNFNTVIINLGNTYSLPVIRIDTVLRRSESDINIKPNYVSNDGVHLSDSGNIVVANEIIKAIGSEIASLFKDTISPVTVYDLPSGTPTMPHVVFGNDGKFYQQPNRPFNGIQNVFSESGFGTNAQANSMIHVSSFIKSDSALLIHSSQGLRIGFNGGSHADAGSTGSNIQITNMGTNGVGFPQAWDNITGLRNIKINGATLKSAGTANITGNDNVIIKNGNNIGSSESVIISAPAAPTSGRRLFYVGQNAGNGVTNGNYNIHLFMQDDGTHSFTSALSSTILFGDARHYTNDNAQNGDIGFSSGVYVTNRFWFGGRESQGAVELNIAGQSGTNVTGKAVNFRLGRGTGSGASGTLAFQTWNSLGSGTTLHSTPNTELTIANDSITVDAGFRVNGNLRFVNGTQGSGKVLTSDANGVATWQTPTGGIPTDSSTLYGDRWLNTFKYSDTAAKTWDWADITGAPSFLTSYTETDPLAFKLSDTASKTWDWGDITGKPTFENPLGFTNGLTRTVDSIKLGGTLNEYTAISLNGNMFDIGNGLRLYANNRVGVGVGVADYGYALNVQGDVYAVGAIRTYSTASAEPLARFEGFNNALRTVEFRNHSTGSSAGSGFRWYNDSTGGVSVMAQFFLTSTTGTSGSNRIILDANRTTLELGSRSGTVNFNTVNVGDANTKMRLFNSGSFGIGVNPTEDASAILFLNSTTKGFLPPRMNTTEQNAISSPTNGLIIYNTDSGFHRYYGGGSWKSFGSGGGGGGIPTDSSTLYGDRWLNTFKYSDTAAKTWDWADITGAPAFLTSYTETDPLSFKLSDTASKTWDWADITGRPTFLIDAAGNGVLVRTSAGVTTNRTLTGTSNRLSVTDGDGTGGNPTFDVVSTSAATASRIMERDANANTLANNFVPNITSTATAAGTTTLTVSSAFDQRFTGSTTQTVVLPNATTLTNGHGFRIHNASTGAVTVQTNGGATLWTLPGNTDLEVHLVDNGTAAGIWEQEYDGHSVATGKILTVSNSVTLAGTDATTMTFPSTSANVVGETQTQTLTNKRLTPRDGNTTSSATPTINTDNVDQYRLTAQTVDITSFTTNLSGTPTHGQRLLIEITGTASRAITWGASFEASSIALPTTTSGTATLSVLFTWNSATSKWRIAGTW